MVIYELHAFLGHEVSRYFGSPTFAAALRRGKSQEVTPASRGRRGKRVAVQPSGQLDTRPRSESEPEPELEIKSIQTTANPLTASGVSHVDYFHLVCARVMAGTRALMVAAHGRRRQRSALGIGVNRAAPPLQRKSYTSCAERSAGMLQGRDARLRAASVSSSLLTIELGFRSRSFSDGFAFPPPVP